MIFGRTIEFRIKAALAASCILLSLSGALLAQTAVPVGGGSYASSIPPTNQFSGGYYSMTAQQVVTNYLNLKMDPALTNRPIPSNRWWTDLLVGDRSYQPTNGGPRILQQDAFGGSLWAYPAVVNPEPTGLKLYFPNSWTAQSNTNQPQGNFNQGPALEVTASVPIPLTANETLIANFEGTNYPAGWTTTGTAFGTGPIVGGTWPGQSPAVKGFIGNACVNTYRGSDSPQGTLTSPEFTVQQPYIHLLAGGGNTTNTAVRLVVNSNVVAYAYGRQSGTLYWNTWDVSAYIGQAARIQVVDLSSGGWGFILCDFIVASDDAMATNRYTDVFSPIQATVTDWSDWAVAWTQPDAQGRSMETTLARGVPFVWTVNHNLNPRIKVGVSTNLYDAAGAVISRTNGSTFAATMLAFEAQNRWWGIYAPSNTAFRTDGDYLEAQLSGASNYLVYATLPSRTNLAAFAEYAYARVTGTEFSWSHERAAGDIVTSWRLTTSPLQGDGTNTLQGWLPHAWRTTQRDFGFLPWTYLTPRGLVKVAAGTQFEIRFPFRGIVPVLPAPTPSGLTNDFDLARMTRYVTNFARSHPTQIGDSYGAGKEFAIAAQHMTFARQLGLTNTVTQLRTNLVKLLTNWFTYTPGERNYYFARYDNWRALIGFPPGYGSEAFNDNHFHYGYFTLASGLVALEDTNFLASFGAMARLVAKEYANWDRSDTDFPFLRTFDAWEGHSWAGGFGASGGNNQESSSEAMNSWVGLFMLGTALKDDTMVSAGAMGYAIESAAVNEYWQDWKHENFPAGYGKNSAGIVWSGNVSYATYFSGDPAWIYGIQWVPANHWNNYLSRDRIFAAGQLSNMWNDRVVASASGLNGFHLTDANQAVALGGYLGNYVLGFQTTFDSEGVASLFDAAYATNAAIATDTVYAGVTYYLCHAQRVLGAQDLESWTTIPTSQVYLNPRTGQLKAVIYNPNPTNQPVSVFRRGSLVTNTNVPPRTTSTLALGSLRAQLHVPPDWQMDAPSGFAVQVEGFPNTPYLLECATNLVNWTGAGTIVTGSNGLLRVVIPWDNSGRGRFFRANEVE